MRVVRAAGKGAADELAPPHSVYAYPKNPPEINVAWIPAAEAPSIESGHAHECSLAPRRVFRGEGAAKIFRAILNYLAAAANWHHSQPPSKN